jgi:hypothetical protein
MDWRGGVYDSVISLGTNCAVATHLNENLLRTEAFPFDWLISADINKIRGLTESGFADFMRYENLKDMTPPGSASGHVVDEANGLRFFHDFCPRLLDVQYGQIREKYKNRTEAFMRRIDGGSKCLFVRKQAKDESLEDTVAIGRFLREKHGPVHELMIVSAEQSDEFAVRRIESGIYCARLSHAADALKNPASRTWEGNYKHWNMLLSNTYCRPTARVKRWLLSEIEKLLRLSARKKGRLVFWGMGKMAERLLPYFVNRGLAPVFYDRDTGLKLNETYGRIEKEELLRGSGDCFVVVTPEKGRDEIAEELEKHGYRRDENYGMIPCALMLWPA